MSQEEIQSIELTDDQLEDIAGGHGHGHRYHQPATYGFGNINETVNINITNQIAIAGGNVTQINGTAQS